MFFLHPLHKRKKKMPWRHRLYPSAFSARWNKLLITMLFFEAVYGFGQICHSLPSYVRTINTTEYSTVEPSLSIEQKGGEEGYTATIYGIQIHLKKWEIQIYKTRQDRELVSP